MAYVKLAHAGHFLCHVRHHVLTMYKRSDITSDKVSHIKPAHAGHFQFYVRHVPRGPHIWRTLELVWQESLSHLSWSLEKISLHLSWYIWKELLFDWGEVWKKSLAYFCRNLGIVPIALELMSGKALHYTWAKVRKETQLCLGLRLETISVVLLRGLPYSRCSDFGLSVC